MNDCTSFVEVLQTLQAKLSISKSSLDLKPDLLKLKEWVAKDPKQRPISQEDLANAALLADLQQQLQKLKKTAREIDQLQKSIADVPLPPLRSGHLSLASLAISVKLADLQPKSLPPELINALKWGDLASRYGPIAKLYICNGFKPSVHVVYTKRSDAAAALTGISAVSFSDAFNFKVSVEWVISGDMDCSLSCGNWDSAVGCTYVLYSMVPMQIPTLMKLISNTFIDPRSVPKPSKISEALEAAAKALIDGRRKDDLKSGSSQRPEMSQTPSSAKKYIPTALPKQKGPAMPEHAPASSVNETRSQVFKQKPTSRSDQTLSSLKQKSSATPSQTPTGDSNQKQTPSSGLKQPAHPAQKESRTSCSNPTLASASNQQTQAASGSDQTAASAPKQTSNFGSNETPSGLKQTVTSSESESRKRKSQDQSRVTSPKRALHSDSVSASFSSSKQASSVPLTSTVASNVSPASLADKPEPNSKSDSLHEQSVPNAHGNNSLLSLNQQCRPRQSAFVPGQPFYQQPGHWQWAPYANRPPPRAWNNNYWQYRSPGPFYRPFYRH